MVTITVELVRKRAEHHDRQLAPLEEIALHQENLESIEHLQSWCPRLKILLLQSNLLARIDHLHRLKHLTYLNLALNNIERIENLEGCESLQKLDLTLNFIGEITSVESLAGNYNLELLYLTGNPCTDFGNYREFVVASLPQLVGLDGVDIERSERIRALQDLPHVRGDVVYEQADYRCQRKKQKARLEREMEARWKLYENLDEDERNERYWKEKCEHAPEVRIEMEKYKNLKLEGLRDEKPKEEKTERKLFAPDGRPFNVNQPKVPFKFVDTEEKLVLNVEVFKHLDTSLIDVDIQPNYARVTLKGKILQLSLPAEVNTTESTAQRSQTTGHLVLTMPKMNVIKKKTFDTDEMKHSEKTVKNKTDLSELERKYKDCVQYNGQSRREFLEIGSEPPHVLDFTKMARSQARSGPKYIAPRCLAKAAKQPSSDFVDNPDVPGLE